MKCIIASFLICFGVAGCNAQKEYSFARQKNNNTLLWQVSGNGLQHPSFLFGTFHLMCKGDIYFSAQLKEAIKASDEIYMELDMDDPSTLLSGMFYMNMKDGKKLSDLYTPEEFKKLQTYFTDSLNMPMMLLQSMKPYFLVALLYPKLIDNRRTAAFYAPVNGWIPFLVSSILSFFFFCLNLFSFSSI